MNKKPEYAIRLSDVSKHYRCAPTAFGRLSEMMFPGSVRNVREFAALQRVTANVTHGTALGIIGRNGAGKSTLLKVLAGIITPTAGKVELVGKVASIIELGSGFHPDFTGKENVALNASMMGIPAYDIPALTDEITAFTQLGRYMDMPVKTYSSGMFVRLAFAFAVSVKPDILLVDEALAVGDAVFSHKCVARIRAMKEQGVTIVFVSHDTGMVAQVCDRCLLLEHGSVVAEGTTKEVVHRYLQMVATELTESAAQTASVGTQTVHTVGAQETSATANLERRFGSFDAMITDIFFEDMQGNPLMQVMSGEQVRFRFFVRVDKDITDPVFGIMIRNRFGLEIFGTNSELKELKLPSCHAGKAYEVTFEMPLLLGGGSYSASFAIHAADGTYYDYRDDALVFEVIRAKECGGMITLPTCISMSETDAENTSSIHKQELIYAGASNTLHTATESALQYMTGDWHEAVANENDTGRWMGASASFILRIPESASRLFLKIATMRPDVHDNPIAVRIELDGILIGTYQLTSHEQSVVSFNLPAMNPAFAHEFTLSSDTWSPADFGGEDPRALSQIVYEIKAL